MSVNIKTKIKELPQKPGVYIFKDKHEAVLYIGKAKNLKNRVLSHFAKPADGMKQKMVQAAAKIDFIQTQNENKALILEEQLIKKFQPRFNIDWKDDKSYLWVFVSDEPHPRIWVGHKLKVKSDKQQASIGPFVNSRQLKSLLRQIRKIIPYRTCRTLPKKACLQYDLQNCPGWCLPPQQRPGLGKLQNRTFVQTSLKLITQLLKIYQGQSGRIEIYDISNIQGVFATGSMVVIKNNRLQKKEYRLFKIKTVQGADDPKMQAEIISRRLNHPEWPKPDLILLDGGKGQLGVVGKILDKTDIPYLGLAKKEERLYCPYSKNSILLSSLPPEIANLLMRGRDEAHRFAINYHRKLRQNF